MFTKHIARNTATSPDLWAVWPCGTECSLDDPKELADMLSWKSDDYEIKQAQGYDESFSPFFD